MTRQQGSTVSSEQTAARLRLVVGRLNRRLRIEASPGIPPLQLSVLATLSKIGQLRISDLARLEAVTPPTMSRVLSALEDNGFIIRRQHPNDARSAQVMLTDVGRQTLDRVRNERTATVALRLERLDRAQRAALEAALPSLEMLVEEDLG